MTTKTGKVLCVDDEPNILRSLQWLLQKEFEVMTAPGGPEGLELVRKNDFDVVISDQRMPGMIGSEFLREVRKLSPRTMRILLTGYSDLQAILNSVNESEVFRFINKPWNISELPKVVREAAAISHSAPAAQTPEPETSSPQPGETILVIDDDPSMAAVVEGLVGERAKIIRAANLAEAIAAFNSAEIGVILADTRVGNMDSTRLLKMLKSEHPDIVSVVSSAESDVDAVISLINQGQIYRFVPKPVKGGHLKLVMTSAMLKRKELRENPDAVARHRVERVAEGTQESFVRDVQEVAVKATPPASDPNANTLVRRLSDGFKRLFGR